MDPRDQFRRLHRLLEQLSYKHLDRLHKFPTIFSIPVHDFICIVSLLGNKACRPFCSTDPFPRVYSKEKFSVTKEEQQLCCEIISEFAVKLHFRHKLNTSAILSATRSYTQQRAEFLMTVCDYLDQMLMTPPETPASSPATTPPNNNTMVDEGNTMAPQKKRAARLF